MSISILFFTGCGGESTSTPSITAIVQIDNTTEFDLYQLYIKPSDVSDWGIDLLPDDKYIPSKTKVDFETSNCDSLIDIKVTGLLGSPISIIEQVELPCGSEFVYKIVN
jgi:hypothetical protein